MFTGIVQAVGEIASHSGARLCVVVPAAWQNDPWVIGESVAVNGCCLTLVGFEGCLSFDLSAETLSRTTLGSLSEGSKVNLERAIRAGERFGGHFVQGHVDTVGQVTAVGPDAAFEVAGEHARYLVDKGSIAIDGVSLTIVRPDEGRFSVALVPHTLDVTTLGGLQPGAMVNVEFDVLAKYALSPR